MCSCAQDTRRSRRLRLDLHEALDVPGVGELVFHRGGNGYLDGRNVKYGHVAVDDLRERPRRPVPSDDGRGEPAPLARDGPAYSVAVAPTPVRMLYKSLADPPPGKSKRGAKWAHYADPAAQQGDRDDIHYTVLCWSWPRDESDAVCRGGGMVRALLAPGTVVESCDVEWLTSGSWDKESNRNGEVVGVYVRAEQGGNPLHGWVMHSHRYEPPGAPPDYVAHLRGL
jgi:hypothetical protein